MNIDSVAARSGAARTTIYRRYRSRDELMTAVLEHVIDPASLAPDLPVAEKLRWVLDRISDILENRLGPGATAAIIADSDPEFTTARARLAVRLSALADLMNLDIKTDRLLGASSGMDNSSTCRTCRPPSASVPSTWRHRRPRARSSSLGEADDPSSPGSSPVR